MVEGPAAAAGGPEASTDPAGLARTAAKTTTTVTTRAGPGARAALDPWVAPRQIVIW